MNEPNASERAKTVTSSRWGDPQLDRAQYAAAALFGRYAEIRERVRELKNSPLTAAGISELADLTAELVELADLNERLREIGERILAADKAPRSLDRWGLSSSELRFAHGTTAITSAPAAQATPNMSTIQCKMARTALGWGVRALADEAGVSPDTVARFERREALKEKTVEALQHALEASGVAFTNGDTPGVSVRKGVSKERRVREI